MEKLPGSYFAEKEIAAKKLSRRAFVKTATTVTGGLLLGFHIPSNSKMRPYEPYADTGAEINAWLSIVWTI